MNKPDFSNLPGYQTPEEPLPLDEFMPNETTLAAMNAAERCELNSAHTVEELMLKLDLAEGVRALPTSFGGDWDHEPLAPTFREAVEIPGEWQDAQDDDVTHPIRQR